MVYPESDTRQGGGLTNLRYSSVELDHTSCCCDDVALDLPLRRWNWSREVTSNDTHKYVTNNYTFYPRHSSFPPSPSEGSVLKFFQRQCPQTPLEKYTMPAGPTPTITYTKTLHVARSWQLFFNLCSCLYYSHRKCLAVVFYPLLERELHTLVKH